MRVYDANSWELYRGKVSLDKKIDKKWKKIKRDHYNSFMVGSARKNARTMRREPSELEKRMQTFLNNQEVYYEFQKVFHIKDTKGYIKRYYIADFFIPKRNLIIETDGKFHENQVEQDTNRTLEIQKYCGDYRVLRWRWHDFESIKKLKELTAILKGK